MTNQKNTLSEYVDDLEKYDYVIGLDEVGWGAIAGPLVVSACVLSVDFENPVIKKTKSGIQYGFKDSKRFTTRNSRLKGAEYAKANVLAHEVMFSMSQDVATYGPQKALSYIQKKLIYKLTQQYPKALIVVDGNKKITGMSGADQCAIIGADAIIPAVSAASIIAKVERDEYMIELSNEYPEWDFHKNKGYPTPEHLDKLKEMGPTKIHRLNVSLVEDALKKKGWYLGEEKS